MKYRDLHVRTWVEIDRGAIKKNYRVFRREIPKETKLMAVVKSNAYGNELIGFSKELDSLGADAFGVDSITEAVTLRAEGITKPILILGHTIPENYLVASEKNISVTLSSFDALKFLLKLEIPVRVHIKIDSGMHRQGFYAEEAEKLAKALKRAPHIIVEGMYTHFASAKDPKHSKETDAQAEAFLRAADVFEKAGFTFIKHTCATGGTLLFPQYHFDMVRTGIGLHGLWPAKESEKARGKEIHLSPILSWKTIVAEVKTVKKGEGIGYDFTEMFKHDSKIAICPVGYWHGFSRAFSSTGSVLIRGQRARVLGRVSMDMIAVDVSKIPNIRLGDEVVLLGTQKKDRISAEELADISGTTNYEVVTRINPKICRVFI